MTNVPLFVNGEGMSGGRYTRASRACHSSARRRRPLGTGSSRFAMSFQGCGRWMRAASASRESSTTCRWM